MFRPTLKYTTKLVDPLLRIENARATVDALPLDSASAKEFQELQRRNCLEAARTLAGRPVPGYERALLSVAKRTTGCPDEGAFERLQATLINSENAVYRTTSDLVYNQGGTDVLYVPPDAPEVPTLMHDLVAWLKLNWERLPAVVLAGICQQELSMIRPFEQESDMFAMLAGDMVLARRGYGLAGYAWPEIGLGRDLNAFEAASTSMHTGVYPSQGDFTAWLDFFADAMAASATAARDGVIARSQASSGRTEAVSPDGPVYLRDRQRQALEYIRLNGAIRSGQYQDLVRIVPDTARRDFTDLLEKGLIAARGVGRGTHYVLTTRGAEEISRSKR